MLKCWSSRREPISRTTFSYIQPPRSNASGSFCNVSHLSTFKLPLIKFNSWVANCSRLTPTWSKIESCDVQFRIRKTWGCYKPIRDLKWRGGWRCKTGLSNLRPAGQRVARHEVLCGPPRGSMWSATRFYVARHEVLCGPPRSSMWPGSRSIISWSELM